MRVLLLGAYPPPHGGVQTNLAGIRRFLRQRGFPCAVINLTRFRRADADEIYYPHNALQVLGLLLRLRYDVVHLHIGGTITARLLALGLVCCLMPRAKAVLSFHSGGYASFPEGRSASPRTLRGLILRRFDRVIAVNQEIVKLFHRFGVPAGRVRLIPPHFLELPPEVDWPARLRQFMQSHRPLLLTVGGLEPEYDLPLQIDVLCQIQEHFPQAGLVIVGAGSLEEDLRARIRAAPCAADILLWGDLPHPITLRAIAECDVLLRTTLYDGDAISVREALALGTPVIATDNGMRPPGVRLVPPSNPALLRAAIEECLAAAPSSRQPRNVQSDDRNLQAILDLYRELVG